MTIEAIRQELIAQGKNPDDFNIAENGSSVIPKWYAETKWVAQKEDRYLGIELTDRELENIELGQQMTDLELQVLGGI